MYDTVSWIVTLAVKPGELDAFRVLMGEMVVHAETGNMIRVAPVEPSSYFRSGR